MPGCTVWATVMDSINTPAILSENVRCASCVEIRINSPAYRTAGIPHFWINKRKRGREVAHPDADAIIAYARKCLPPSPGCGRGSTAPRLPSMYSGSAVSYFRVPSGSRQRPGRRSIRITCRKGICCFSACPGGSPPTRSRGTSASTSASAP